MNDQDFTCSLMFSGFAIDYDVKIVDSLEWTADQISAPNDFVFVVAETWLRIAGSRYLIESAIRPGNQIEELKVLACQLSSPVAVEGIENVIPLGGWATWMKGYWERIDEDTSTSDDEALYEKLISLSLMESRDGHMAAYMYNHEPVIEAATRSENETTSVSVFARFDCKKTERDINSMQQFIKNKILSIRG